MIAVSNMYLALSVYAELLRSVARSLICGRRREHDKGGFICHSSSEGKGGIDQVAGACTRYDLHLKRDSVSAEYAASAGTADTSAL